MKDSLQQRGQTELEEGGRDLRKWMRRGDRRKGWALAANKGQMTVWQPPSNRGGGGLWCKHTGPKPLLIPLASDMRHKQQNIIQSDVWEAICDRPPAWNLAFTAAPAATTSWAAGLNSNPTSHPPSFFFFCCCCRWRIRLLRPKMQARCVRGLRRGAAQRLTEASWSRCICLLAAARPHVSDRTTGSRWREKPEERKKT